MRQIAVNVYQFEELNEQAQHNAYETFCYESSYPFHYDNEKSIVAIEDVCNININNWEYDMHRYSFNIQVMDVEDINLYGEELKAALIERFGDYMNDKKEAYGYFLDMDFFYHMKTMLPKITKFTTYMDVMNYCTHKMFEEMVNDIENYYSFDNFKDLAGINEWEFLENGDMY